ncbi:MAG: hypothetical protein IKX20_04660 [Paludibacteraceae bacterium]|nr:hypothetical protein [Paludibacteraceae bacterium]
MARLILHARYFAPNAKKRAARLSYLMKYYATREGVEKPNHKQENHFPASENQQETIRKMLEQVPELTDTHEYEDYTETPTVANASELITRGAEYLLHIGKPDIYLQYIAERPRVEKIGDHGLFAQTDEPIDLPKVAKAVSEHLGNVWTLVFSLRRPDAERLGYNNAESWRTLCRAKADTIAQAMKIPGQDLQWYAAFHNEGHHPHIHMVAYSTGTEGYLTRYGIDDIKSAFASEIFRLDLMEIYKEQTKLRNDLRQMADDYMHKLRDLPQSAGEFADLIPMLSEIHRRLPQKGKLKYGYMPKDVKNLVDEVVDRLEKHPKVAELYELWYQQKCAIIATYTNNYPPKEPLSENEAFRPIKNAVLEAAKEMGEMVEMTEMVGGQEMVAESPRLGTGGSGEEGVDMDGQRALEEAIARIEREHGGNGEIMPGASGGSEDSLPSFRSIESFLYRVSKVFEDKRPVGNQGQAMDRKAYVRQAERKREMGMQ